MIEPVKLGYIKPTETLDEPFFPFIPDPNSWSSSRDGVSYTTDN